MTDIQKKQFNRMREALKRIASEYQTPRYLQKNAEKEYGISYIDALEMAYENIKIEAKSAVKGIRSCKIPIKTVTK